jgi:hypothetical protein
MPPSGLSAWKSSKRFFDVEGAEYDRLLGTHSLADADQAADELHLEGSTQLPHTSSDARLSFWTSPLRWSNFAS